MTLKHWVGLSVIGGALAWLAIGSMHASQRQDPGHAGMTAATLVVSSASFADGASMPAKLSCDGTDVSPDLQWSAAPAGTKSYAVVMNDPDAPQEFIHWLAYDIPGSAHELPEGASTAAQRLSHAAEGINSFGNVGYGGPCPPGGSPHRYVFHVYALDIDPRLAAGLGKQQLMAAIQGHVLVQGQITGLYGRHG